MENEHQVGVVEGRGNGDGQGFKPDWGGAGRRVKRPQIPEEFITPANNLIGQLSKCRLKDLNDLKTIIRYYSHLKILGLEPQIDILRTYLAGTPSVGGRGIDSAHQSYAGLYFDRDMSKEDKKAILEMQARSRKEAVEKRENEAETP